MAHVNETDRVEELMSKWNGMDVVGYIVVQSGVQDFTSDRHKLHTVFRRLREQATGVEAEVLSEFVFATRDVFPFSRELERAVAYLELGGLLVTDNPQFVRFRICDDQKQIDSLREEAAHIFSGEERRALEQLAAKFQKEVEE